MKPLQEGDAEKAASSTVDLVALARGGDRNAVEKLCERYLPRLRRWAKGRLPSRARDLLDTDDLAQEVLLRTIRRVETPGSPVSEFHAYLRQALTNRVRDEIRRVQRAPEQQELDDEAPAGGPSPLEATIGREKLERYEAGLRRLKDEDREAVIARIEVQMSYEEIALVLGKPTANAARMMVVRGLEKLLREMDDAV